MDFKQLEVFEKVVQLGSFSKAAEALHLTQPTVSSHIQSLETELNTKLLVRTSRGAHASKSGKKLYTYATEMLALRERALCACQEKTDIFGGRLSVVASSIPYQYLLPQAMSAFREKHPNVSFRLLRRDSAAVEEAILAGEAELGLSGTCNEKSALSYRLLCYDELVLITPVTEPYIQRKNRPFLAEELLQFSFVLREGGSGTRREAEQYFIGQGIQPSSLKEVAKMDNPDAVNSAVGGGLGVSIVSRLSAEDAVQRGLVLMFQLGDKALERPLYLVQHKRRAPSILVKRFEKQLVQLFVKEASQA